MPACPIELYVPLPLAPSAARQAFAAVIREFGQGTGSPDRYTLAVYLRDIHVAARGEIRVPVAMQLSEQPARWEAGISIRAASDAVFFPKFEGTLSITPVAATSELWLQGTYEPPFGLAGALLDRTIFRNAAKRSLNAFLGRIAQDITGEEREREERYARDVRDMHH